MKLQIGTLARSARIPRCLIEVCVARLHDAQRAQVQGRRRAPASASLAVRANLAAWTGNAGDATAARDQYAALLPPASGSPAPTTLTDRGNLASWTVQA